MNRKVSSIGRTIAYIALIFAALMSASGCDLRALMDPTVNSAKIKIEVDWSNFPEDPTGMTVKIFNEEGLVNTILTNDTEDVYTELSEGHYRIYVFNQSTDEFSTLWFWNMDEYEDPEAVIVDDFSTWYDSKADGDDSRTVYAPEDLGIAVGEFEVTSSMVSDWREYRSWVKSGTKTRQKSKSKTKAGDDEGLSTDENGNYVYTEYSVITLHPMDVTYDLQVTAYLSGIQNLKDARASLTGMTEGYMLTQGATSEVRATQLLTDWEKHVYEEDNTKGYIRMRSLSTTFGFPSWGGDLTTLRSRSPESNSLTLEFLLRDNKSIVEYPFVVGDKFEYEKYDGGRLRIKLMIEIGNRPGEEIVVPDVPEGEDDQTEGAFRVDVDDWDEGETETILM